MAYGLRVKNSSGELQIDSTYRNLAYAEGASGAVITNSYIPGNGGYSTLISIASNLLIPLILIRPNTNRFVTIENYQRNGSNNYTGFKVITELNQSTTIDWRCYRETSSNPSGYGLRVKDSSGNMIFSSLLNYFKIYSVSTITLNPPSRTWPGYEIRPYQDISHAGISNPYYILTPVGDYIVSEPGDIYGTFWRFMYCKIGIKKLSSTSVRVGWFHFTDDAIEDYVPEEGWNPTVKLIVCQI